MYIFLLRTICHTVLSQVQAHTCGCVRTMVPSWSNRTVPGCEEMLGAVGSPPRAAFDHPWFSDNWVTKVAQLSGPNQGNTCVRMCDCECLQSCTSCICVSFVTTLMTPHYRVLVMEYKTTINNSPFTLSYNHLGNQLTAYLWFMVCILYIRITRSAIKCAHMADARDTFHAVKSMSILCLWDIQLTFDRNGVGNSGAYHHKSELKRCNRVQFVF